MTTDRLSFAEQYDALRVGAGFVELADWSSVTFTGADRQTFLNSFCTNDVKGLAPGRNCEAFVTNVKGRTIGYGLVDCRDNELVFVTVPNQSASLVSHFDRYIIREDVQVRDTTGERAYFQAPILPPTSDARWLEWKLLGDAAGAVVEVATDEVEAFRQILRDRKFVPCGAAAFESHRIEAGTPLFSVDFNEGNLPQEVGRDREAISFTKGCYLGQETVARIDALGHVNQKLSGVRFLGNAMPNIGVQLLSGEKEAGRVTSVAFSPRLGSPLGFAMLRREASAPGTLLDSAVGACEVVSLPIESCGVS
jgi:tRNA-modifying protein YgfZ